MTLIYNILRSTRRWVRPRAAVLLVAAVAVLASCNKNEGANSGGATSDPPSVKVSGQVVGDDALPPTVAAAAPAQVVAVEEIAPIDQLFDVISLPGVTEPNRVVNVASEVAGRVEAVLVEENQFVSCAGEGCVLVRLNTDLLQADYDRNKSEAEFNQRDYERLADAFRQGVATQTEVDQARMRAESYKALMASSAAQLERSTIMAPIDGIVNDLPVEEGEYLQPGTPVAEIVDLDVVKVAVEMPERDVSFLSLGDEVTVTAAWRGDEQTFVGTVTYISQVADPSTFTSRVDVSVPNPDRQLRTGQIVNIRVTRRIIDNAILVPLLAVIPRENDYIVYIANDSHAHRRVVELGLIRGQEVQIVSGLQVGDRLIIAGQRYVSDGQAIRIEPTVEQKLRAEVGDDPEGGDRP